MQCKRGSPSYTLGCSSSQCIRAWMHQQPRPMKLAETHKKKKPPTVNAPPCRQRGRHGRQKNARKRSGRRKRSKQRLGRRKKLSCRECSQPADAAPRQAKRKSQEEKTKARNKRRRELRQQASQSQDPEARGKIERVRDARRVADANARSGWRMRPPAKRSVSEEAAQTKKSRSLLQEPIHVSVYAFIRSFLPSFIHSLAHCFMALLSR